MQTGVNIDEGYMLKRLIGSRGDTGKITLAQECHEWMVEHSAKLLAYTRLQLGGEGDAEMMLTQVSGKVLRVYCAGKVNKEGLLPYMLRSLSRAAIDEKEKISRRSKAEAEYEQEREAEATPFEPEDAHLRAKRLMLALPEELAVVVMLKVWGEMSYGQIAAHLGITESAARFRYNKGIEQVRFQMMQ